MSVDIRYPNITGLSEKEQLMQIKSFLHQLVDQLNYELSTGGSGSGQTFSVQGKEVSYYELQSLIMKELQEMEVLFHRLSNKMQSEYVRNEVLPEVIEDALTDSGVLMYTEQVLTEEQQTQSRKNIGFGTMFSRFPSEAEVNAMADLTVFTTYGYHTKADGFGCTYIVRDTPSNLFIPYGNKFIRVAFVDENVRDIKPEWYGIRRGSASATYADENSVIMDKLASVLQNGYTLSFGSGHYYFAKPFAFSKYTMVKGICTNATVSTSDVNFGTYLHFPSIADGEAAIALNGGGVVQDVGIVGNASVCTVTLDRTYTATDPNSVISLVDTGTTYGIKTGGGFVIQNVRLRNFTYGIYTPSGNSSISHVDIRQCKIGISVGNDIKVSNIQVWNVMVGIELRGSLASATNIRGDSIGEHLIVCVNGKCTLTNIDGDYCFGSLIHYGGGNWRIHLGQAIGCMGRIATKHSYSRSEDFDLRSVPDEDYAHCSYISIAPNTRVFGGHIEITNVSTNVMDTPSEYVHPNAAISIGKNCTIKGVTIKCNVPYTADTEYFNRAVIKNLSTLAESVNDSTNYVTDFDGSVIEDINFITPIGFVRTIRTPSAPDRVLISTVGSEKKTDACFSMMEAVEILVPSINLNDGVYEYGRFASDGSEYTDSPSDYSFRSANYIPVEGGRTITLYFDAYEWNNNNMYKGMHLVQYDSNKNIIGSRQTIDPYAPTAGKTGVVLDTNTAFVRVAMAKYAAVTTPLTDIKVAIYYIEDVVKEFVEHGQVPKTTYAVNGDKVLLKSPNGTKYALTVADDGTLSVKAFDE